MKTFGHRRCGLAVRPDPNRLVRRAASDPRSAGTMPRAVAVSSAITSA
jgi:hypothetical protein